MKTILLILLTASVMYGQTPNQLSYLERYLKAQFENAGVGGADSSASILNRAYVAATNDTTEVISTRNYGNLFLTVQSKDSASIHIKYQLSSDGVTWGVLTTLDSLSTGSNAGDVKALSLNATVLGAPFVRFVLDPTAYRLGTSTATYTAYILQKK